MDSQNSNDKTTEKSGPSFYAIAALIVVTFFLVLNTYSGVFGQRTTDASDDGNLADSISAQAGESSAPETLQPVVDDEPDDTDEADDEPDDTDEEDDETDEDHTEIPEGIDIELAISEITVVDISEADAEISETLSVVARNYNSVAVSLAVFDGELDFFTYQFGLAELAGRRDVDADTKFRIASLSKLVTVILAMALVEADALDLDADISNYLGYEVRNPVSPETPITSRMLMQHTSSIIDSDAYLSDRFTYSAETTGNLLGRSSSYSDNKPGTEHEYSDFGFIVLGAICEKVSDMLLDELAAEVLFTPLRIDAAFVANNLENKNIAAIYNERHNETRSVRAQVEYGSSGNLSFHHNLSQGSLLISTVDYARILSMLVNGGELDGVRILSEDSVLEIHNTDFDAEHYQQGLATRFQEAAFMDEDVYWHTGSAYGVFAQYIYSIEEGRGVVIVTTGATTDREPNGMIKLCNALAEVVWNALNPDAE